MLEISDFFSVIEKKIGLKLLENYTLTKLNQDYLIKLKRKLHNIIINKTLLIFIFKHVSFYVVDLI